jgi:hypothetical protein
LKVMLLSCLALLAVGGIAKASGLIGHEDKRLDEVAQRTQTLEQGLRQNNGATASRVRRGPRGPRGPQGPKGATGATGAPGAKGSFAAIVSVASAPTFLCSFESGSCAVGSARAECPPGTTLVGGGYTGAGIVTTVTYDAPSGNGWGIVAANLDEVPVTSLRAVAQCGS